jgi:hypothetical protein
MNAHMLPRTVKPTKKQTVNNNNNEDCTETDLHSNYDPTTILSTLGEAKLFYILRLIMVCFI